MVLTQEQDEIIEYMCKPTSQCCIVQAFAGCGKTTLLANMAKRRYDLGLGSTLLLTYSSELKKATRQMAQMQEGLYVESMHSLVRNILFVGHDCLSDKDIENYLSLEKKPSLHPGFLESVTLIVIDEMQDMSPLYYRLVQQLRAFFVNDKIRFVGVGDFFQWLFSSLNGSTPEYMCRPEEYFQGDSFKIFALTLSFRLTQEVCEWINKHLDPRKLQMHYPLCWAKYGASITRYWGNGLRSAKCKQCACVHDAKKPDKCLAIYNSKLIRERQVAQYEVNTFTNILPPELTRRAKAGNAVVIVNGLQLHRFTKMFPDVTSPFAYKGLQTRNVIVAGFDSFTEEVCSQQSNADMEDWPLACYCQMYVSCTRPENKLFLAKSRTKPAFFTTRDVVLSIGHSLQASQKTTRIISRLFEFIPHDDSRENKQLDMALQTTIVARCDDIKLYAVKDTAPGVIPNTLIHDFHVHYHRAVIIAVYLFFTYDEKKPMDWTRFMRVNVLKQQAISATWIAETTWCDLVFTRCVTLLQQAGFEVYGKCLVPFEFSRLRGILHFTARWGAMIQVVFDNSRKSLHEAMMNYLCFRRFDPHTLAVNCYVLRPLTNELLKLELLVPAEYYMSRIVSRKKWDFLLPSSFSLDNLHARGVPVPEKQLHVEQEMTCKKQKIETLPLGNLNPPLKSFMNPMLKEK